MSIITDDIDNAVLITLKHAIHIVEAAKGNNGQAITNLYSWLVELEGEA